MKKEIATLIIVLVLMLASAGCEDGLLTGLLIGAGTSTVATEGQQLAEKNKVALVEEILVLRSQIEISTDPGEVDALRKKLAIVEKKNEIAEITTIVADKVNEGLQRDWSTKDPEKQQENWEWMAGTASAGILYLLQKRKNRGLEKGLARVKGESTTEEAKRIHDTVKHYTDKWLA